MWKHCNKLLLSVLLLALAGCAGTGPGEEAPATGAKTDAAKGGPELDKTTVGLYERAVWAMKNERHQEALKLFDQVTERNPDVAGAYINKGLIQLKRGEHQAAKAALLQATTLKPDHAVAQHHLAIAHRELGEFDKAEQAYLMALRLRPDYATAHLNLGILYDIYLGHLEQALQHYQRYMELTGEQDETVHKWIVDLKLRFDRQSAQVEQ